MPANRFIARGCKPSLFPFLMRSPRATLRAYRVCEDNLTAVLRSTQAIVVPNGAAVINAVHADVYGIEAR